MRVLFWSGTFWPTIGGVEVLAARFLPALRERGYEFVVITRRQSSEQKFEDDYLGIPVHRFDFGNPELFSDLRNLRAARKRILEIKREFEPDIVHTYVIDVSSLLHLMTKRDYPVPSVVTLHGDWSAVEAGRDSLIGRVLGDADRVVGCCRAILGRGMEFAPEIARNSSVIYNGVETPNIDVVPLASDPAALLCLSRLMPEKGVDIALEAFKRVEQKFPGTRFLIAGDGDERGRLQRQAQALGLEGVEFLGWKRPEETPQLLNEVTALVQPSRRDSFPLVVLEAAMMQRPVVGTRVGGLPEMIVDGETGVLCPPGDPDSLSDSIMALLGDPQSAARMGAAARERVERCFTWARHVDAYDGLFRKLAESETSIVKSID